MRYDMRNIKETIWYYLECIWNTNCNRNYLKALRHKRTHFEGILKKNMKETEIQDIKELTLKAVCIEEVFAFLVALDSAFGATYPLVRSLFRSCPIENKNLKVSFLSGGRSFGLFAAGKSYFPLDNWRSLENCPQSWHSHGLCSGQQIWGCSFDCHPHGPTWSAVKRK